MKFFVILIFVSCAVNCDKSGNYYVIERPSEAPVRELRPFHVYWNVPTFQCKSKKITFENLFEKYGIVQNQDDTFQGEQITILYDPGLFPAILKEESSGKLRTRNGGVPQEGNLDEHLTAFRYVLDQSIPDPQFSGIGVIDFESWRPVFRQNSWGVLTPYRNLSLLIERRLHPWWTRNMIEREAKYRFERAGREFMQATVALARLLRPQAKWGYYGFPYCFNMAGAKPAETCSNTIQSENDQISWLWSESTALYPSVYSSKNLSSAQLAGLIRGRVAESARVGRGMPILPYFWFKYRDAGFMSEVDLKTALKAMYKSHTYGLILWGSSNDVNSVTKCEKLKDYLENVLGPEIAMYTRQSYKIEETNGISNETLQNNFTTQLPLFFRTGSSKEDENQKKDSENEEVDESSSESIESHFDDERIISTNHSVTTNNEQNILLDIVLSIIENIQKKYDRKATETTMRKVAKNRKKGTPIHDTFTQISDSRFDFTTKSPLSNFKKKGAFFDSLYPSKTKQLQDYITSTAKSEDEDFDFKSTTVLEYMSTIKERLTTEKSYESTTEVDMMYDNENVTANYNQDTFLGEELFNVNETVTENNSTISYNDDDEPKDSVFFDDEVHYSTIKEPNIYDADSTVNKRNETTVSNFFNKKIFENENLYDDGERTTESVSLATFTNERLTHTDTRSAKHMRSTNDRMLSTTGGTTGEDDAFNDTVDDDSEYQVVINLD